MTEQTGGLRGASRAQSTTLGYALLYAMVVLGVVVVITAGSGALTGAEDRLVTERAEKSMTEMDSEIAKVGLGATDSQRVDLATSTSNQYEVVPAGESGAGHITVESSKTGVIMDRDLGQIRFENGDTVVAYQGGGVWKETDGEGAVMVSPPEFHYRDATLTLPIIIISDGQGFDDSMTVSNVQRIQEYPDAGAGFENPLTGGLVTVTVTSDYYEAWGRYFEERTEGTVSYDHSANEVTLELKVPSNYPAVTAGVVTGGPSSTLEIENNAEIDSYDSDTGGYGGCHGPGAGGCTNHPKKSNTSIIIAGDLEIYNNGLVWGNVEAGGNVEFSDPNGELRDGNISYGGSVTYFQSQSDHLSPDPSSSKFWVNDNASVNNKIPDSVSGLIDTKRSALSDPADNDNSAESGTIDTSTETVDCSSDCELTAGSYYLSELNPPSGELVLDTSGGDITIVVDGDFKLGNSDKLDIQGDGRVNIYVEGDVTFVNNAKVENADDDASQLWIYMNPGKTATLKNNVIFRGVIYGPGSGTNPGAKLKLKQNVHVLGALVGDLRIQNQNVWIHYDEALQDADTVTSTSSIPSITYLHISANEVEVDDS